jgi:SecD/SecF fusion protein
VFIAGPVLTHWKEREPVYEARERRIRSQFGGELPAYAVAMAGAPVDVAPKEKRRRERLTQPNDPTQGVSRDEFEEMVRDLGIEEAQERQPAAAARSGRPAGGRRARSRGNGNPPGPGQDGPPKPPADGDSSEKPKKPRNRRHGRPR